MNVVGMEKIQQNLFIITPLDKQVISTACTNWARVSFFFQNGNNGTILHEFAYTLLFPVRTKSNLKLSDQTAQDKIDDVCHC